MMNDQLISWNRRGLIPGPHEEEAAFIARAESASPQTELKGSDFFDMQVDWMPVSFSNKGLSIWHGGCCDEKMIQLREGFAKSERLFGLYSRTEILTHEFFHAARLHFKDCHFEEIMACEANTKPLSRFLGPILAHPLELWFFLGLCLLSAISPWILIAALIAFVWGIGRLQWRRSQLKRARAHLSLDKERARLASYRLSDEEIVWLARLNKERAAAFIAEQHSLRWQMIRASYG